MIPNKLRSRVIGYVCFFQKEGTLFCNGDAGIVAGSSELLKKYPLSSVAGGKQYQLEKVRFAKIMDVLTLNGRYAFDEISYARFKQATKELNPDSDYPAWSLGEGEDGFMGTRLKPGQ